MGAHGAHLEMVVPTDELATLVSRMEEAGFRSSSRRRRHRGVLTLKRTDTILAFLRLCGAGASVLEVESRLVMRQLQGHLNRVLNAETANLERSVASSARQIAVIERLETDGRLAELSDIDRSRGTRPARCPRSIVYRAGRDAWAQSGAGAARLRSARCGGRRRGAIARPMIGSMRPVIITANWKMNTTPAEAGPLARSIADATDVAGVTRVICPPYVALAQVNEALQGSGVAVGAQNVHSESNGAYTGEVSAGMLNGLVTWVIVGHSERRRDQGETDALIGRKIVRLIEAGIRPMLCCGEQLEEREAGRAITTVQAQVEIALKVVAAESDGVPDDLVIAYEPVWAIGTGKTASGVDAAQMAAAIRATVADLAGDPTAEAMPVLYGGSVTSSSFGEFIDEPAIDGALIGGASLKPDEMAGIAARAGVTAAARAKAG